MSSILDPDAFAESDADHADPPTNETGQFVCGRPCADGSRCMVHVKFGYMACYQHDRSQPIVEDDR